ncbi:MAG TPA: TVP38/TMEM64 family protein [Solirubrobacteraceae bacterium]|nr:TVP38/TMEM64 family protein [Solirubrobacteraceae bacterium]
MRALLSSPRLRLGLLLVVVAGGTVAFLVVGLPSQEQVARVIDDAGLLAPLLFVAVYAVLTVLLFPGSVLTAAGGAVFGVLAGTLLAVVGATLGAIGAFMAGRRLGRAQVERIAAQRMGRLDEWMRRRGFLAVLYARLLPVAPFNALNYVAGVTGVSTRDYSLATAIGIVPGTFAYAALGSTLNDPTSPEFLGALALVLVLAVGAPLVERALRRRSAGTPPAGSPVDG